MTSKTLGDLSAAASQGEWSPGHLGDETTKCNCRSVVTDRMLGCVFKALDPADVEERFRREYPTDDESAANMRLVCELVNQFRSGRLVDRNAIIDECAKVAEADDSFMMLQDWGLQNAVTQKGENIAQAIRALKSPSQEGREDT